ncbi:hypothetical protein [Candidatus Uabimicrobium sp. HlEnr_7]|uniref:hypothetical protein n=1 Tax=Candidatus Uabimicrobium helgolandensis TaxID=3095367 RepID=UPI00355811BD
MKFIYIIIFILVCSCTQNQIINKPPEPNAKQTEEIADFSQITRVQYVEWDVSDVEYFDRVSDLQHSKVVRKAFLQKSFNPELLLDNNNDDLFSKIRPHWSWELRKAGEKEEYEDEETDCENFTNRNRIKIMPSSDLEDKTLVMWFVYESDTKLPDRNLPNTLSIYHLDGCNHITTYEKCRRQKNNGKYEILRYAIFPPK